MTECSVFSSKKAAYEFLKNIQGYEFFLNTRKIKEKRYLFNKKKKRNLNQIVYVAKRNPELIQLLEMHNQLKILCIIIIPYLFVFR